MQGVADCDQASSLAPRRVKLVRNASHRVPAWCGPCGSRRVERRTRPLDSSAPLREFLYDAFE